MPQYKDDEELTLNYLEAANDRNVGGTVFANRKNARIYRDALRKSLDYRVPRKEQLRCASIVDATTQGLIYDPYGEKDGGQDT